MVSLGFGLYNSPAKPKALLPCQWAVGVVLILLSGGALGCVIHAHEDGFDTDSSKPLCIGACFILLPIVLTFVLWMCLWKFRGVGPVAKCLVGGTFFAGVTGAFIGIDKCCFDE